MTENKRKASADELAGKLGDKKGKRRQPAEREALPLRWPQTKPGKLDVFDCWHGVAMEIATREKIGFRVLAVLSKLINRQKMICDATDSLFAMHAGRCCDKTIGREIGKLSRAGLIGKETYTTQDRTGHMVKRRRIWPTLPSDLPDDIEVPSSIEFELDTRGPFQNGFEQDNRGPDRRDNRGPLFPIPNKADIEDTTEIAPSEHERNEPSYPDVEAPVSNRSNRKASPKGELVGSGDESPGKARAAAPAKRTGTNGGDMR